MTRPTTYTPGSEHLDHIRDLHAEAAAAGDTETVSACVAALCGDADALAECERLITDWDSDDDD